MYIKRYEREIAERVGVTGGCQQGVLPAGAVPGILCIYIPEGDTARGVTSGCCCPLLPAVSRIAACLTLILFDLHTDLPKSSCAYSEIYS